MNQQVNLAMENMKEKNEEGREEEYIILAENSMEQHNDLKESKEKNLQILANTIIWKRYLWYKISKGHIKSRGMFDP